MGTIAVPSYATIFMGNFEETYIYPRILANCLFYCRLIDDIFLIYDLQESNFNEFIKDLNTTHDSIKFDYVLYIYIYMICILNFKFYTILLITYLFIYLLF